MQAARYTLTQSAPRTWSSPAVPEIGMPMKLLYGTGLLALVCVVHLPATRSAMAVTAELARKCGVLTDKAYPLRVQGNPAAGREHGTAKEVIDYFNKCVANGGNTEEQPPQQGTHTQTPNDGSAKDDQAPQKAR